MYLKNIIPRRVYGLHHAAKEVHDTQKIQIPEATHETVDNATAKFLE